MFNLSFVFNLYLIKFGGHRHSRKGDIMIFVCQVTLQDHVIKALIHFMVRRPSR